MNFLQFIVVSTFCLDYGFRWQTKRAVVLFILALALACQAQEMIVPPTNTLPIYTVFKLPDLNPQPMGDWTNVTLTWEPSPSPDIDHYNIYNSPTLKPWNGHLVGSTTNLTFTLYIGGTTEGFPGVSAVNKQGLESKIRL